MHCLTLVGLIAISVGIKFARNASSPVYTGVTITEPGRGDGINVTASDSDSISSVSTSGTVTFQIAGAVMAPNVYTLPAGSRIIDAIKAAGGAKNGADTQSLNLAARIEDGTRIFIPMTGQQGSIERHATVTNGNAAAGGPDHVKINIVPSTSGASSAADNKLRNPGEGVVNINKADADELQRLPGVGPSTAAKIIDYRSKAGKFASPRQLDDVKGIGPAKLEKMLPFVTL